MWRSKAALAVVITKWWSSWSLGGEKSAQKHRRLLPAHVLRPRSSGALCSSSGAPPSPLPLQANTSALRNACTYDMHFLRQVRVQKLLRAQLHVYRKGLTELGRSVPQNTQTIPETAHITDPTRGQWRQAVLYWQSWRRGGWEAKTHFHCLLPHAV